MQPKLVRELVHKDADIVFVGCGEAHTIAIARDGKYVLDTLHLEEFTVLTPILLALDPHNRAYSWGHSGNGRLGLTLPNINDHVLVPTLISSLNTQRIIAAACGAMHTLFLSENGELFACGNNMFGQLGVGDKDGRNTPVPVIIPSQSTVKPHHNAIAAGQMCSAAIVTVGGEQQALYTWGGNHFGVLGLGEHTQETLLPTVVGSIQQDWLVKAIAIGDFHMCAIADFIGTESGDDIPTSSPPPRQRSMSSLANSDTDRVRFAACDFVSESVRYRTDQHYLACLVRWPNF
jgi:alpha-tubulin suppressor-like RCC1 family protein